MYAFASDDVTAEQKKMSLNKFLFKNYFVCASTLCLLLFLSACSNEHHGPQVSGDTMGTSYSMQWHGEAKSVKIKSIRLAAEQRLLEINQLMSTYIPDSQLSLFNAQDHSGWFAADAELVHVLDQAYSISKVSKGAFDITVGPLVNLWGFGAQLEGFVFPSAAEVRIAKLTLDWERIKTRQQPLSIFKPAENVYVDLSAIAKGYAVDQLAMLLDEFEIENYMVEIGGEVRVKGRNAQGKFWRIAIESPKSQMGSTDLSKVLDLSNTSLATSGNYRNFFIKDGKKYSHTINTTTGRPMPNKLGSVSVVDARGCMQADALATALMVMGLDKALKFANERGIAAYFIYMDDGPSGQAFASVESSKFKMLFPKVDK